MVKTDGWETIYHLCNALMSASDAGRLSKGCHGDDGTALAVMTTQGLRRSPAPPAAAVGRDRSAVGCARGGAVRERNPRHSVIRQITAPRAAGESIRGSCEMMARTLKKVMVEGNAVSAPTMITSDNSNLWWESSAFYGFK